jgi:hypothetical protein
VSVSIATVLGLQGVLQADPVIVVANATAMMLALALAALKLRHG